MGFEAVLEEDGLGCISSNESYPALLVNLELMRFAVILKPCKYSCVGDHDWSPEEFLREVYDPWKRERSQRET